VLGHGNLTIAHFTARNLLPLTENHPGDRDALTPIRTDAHAPTAPDDDALWQRFLIGRPFVSEGTEQPAKNLRRYGPQLAKGIMVLSFDAVARSTFKQLCIHLISDSPDARPG
jgi:hypothetical protein